MENGGWISIYRKSMNHWTWNRKPFDEFHAWVYLLLKASHEPTNHEYRGSMYPLERGELHASIRHLSKEWGWNHKKVSRFIKALNEDNMIVLSNDQPLTKITICNYDYYQLHEHPKGNTDGNTIGSTTGNTTGNATGDQINNINNINNTITRVRARDDYILFFSNLLDLELLTNVWNELNLKRLEFLDDECLEILFVAYISRLESEFPDLPSINDVEFSEWQQAISSQNIPDPTDWACRYLVNGFELYITPFHRGENNTGWIADITYAFKLETIAKVRRTTGVW